MKKIYLSVLALLAFILVSASPDIYTPELVAPSNNQSNAAPNVQLDWNPVTGLLGLHYEVQLSLDDVFTSPAVFTTDLTAFTTSNLLFNQQYFWKVRAVDSQGTSEWSEVRSFTTISKPIIRRPNDNSTGAAPNVQIIWEAVTGVAFFDYQLDISPTFDSTESKITSVTGNLAQTNAANLLFGKTYYLRMRMRHAADTSDWSLVRSFTTVSELSLKKPDNNATAIATDPTFEWNKIDGLLHYNILVSTDPDFSDMVTYQIAKNLLKATPDTLRYGTTYYWKMDGVHTRDIVHSVTRSFTTVDAVALSSPSNNSTNIGLSPSLRWNKLTGTLSYKLELASNSGMNNALTYTIAATAGTGTEFFKVPLSVLDSAGTYFWRVRAISSRDTSGWSETWNFRCVALGVNEPVFRNGLSIYPVPAVDVINIQLKASIRSNAIVSVIDLLGKAKIEREVQISNGFISNFQLGNLPDGIYLLRIEANGATYTSKLIRKQ